MFFPGDGPAEFFINLPVSGVKAAVADHFIMLFRDMLDEALYEFHNRNGFFHVFVIFVSVVVESDRVTIVFIDSGGGNNGAPKVASDIFHNCFGITFVWFGIHVETFFVFPVAEGFYFFKGRTDFCLHLIKQDGTEGIAQVSVVEMIDIAPETIVTVPAFGNETVDMWVPLQIPAKGMEYHDKTGSEIH